MSKREIVIRAALTRYHAGERLRILSYVNDALDREGLRELDHEEADRVMICWNLELLPYGEDPIPVPVSAGAEGDEWDPIDLDEWDPVDL